MSKLKLLFTFNNSNISDEIKDIQSRFDLLYIKGDIRKYISARRKDNIDLSQDKAKIYYCIRLNDCTALCYIPEEDKFKLLSTVQLIFLE